MKLNEIPMPMGRKKKRTKRLGRGDGSGHGGTSTKGHKGQKSRAGGLRKDGFEGGQMPLRRRLPKRGFTNIFRKEYSVVNLDDLSCFEKGSEVTAKVLVERGVVRKVRDGVKLLGRGDITVPLTIKLSAVSESARAKVEKAGGKIEVNLG